MERQVPGHLYGPPAPHIGFWYFDLFLGEVRGHPSAVQTAQTKLLDHIEMLEVGTDRSTKRGALLSYTHAKLYCGDISRVIGGHDPKSPLWNPAVAAQYQREGKPLYM